MSYRGGNIMAIFLTSSPTGPLDNSRKVDGLVYSFKFCFL